MMTNPMSRQCSRQGPMVIFFKTAEPEEIIQGVRDVFHGKSVLDAVLAQRLITRFSAKESPALIEPLTDRELQVLSLAGKGFTNKAIGVQLSISDRTVQNHLSNVFNKLQG